MVSTMTHGIDHHIENWAEDNIMAHYLNYKGSLNPPGQAVMQDIATLFVMD